MADDPTEFDLLWQELRRVGVLGGSYFEWVKNIIS